MIEGYCLRRSYRQGEPASLCVSTDGGRFDAVIYREGRNPVEVARYAAVPCGHHPIPADAVANGCGWPVALSIDVHDGWKSGFYRIDLIGADGERSEASFIVRAARDKAAILWVIETNTWNAYNDFGGASAYTGDGVSFGGASAELSFLRPLPRGFITLPQGCRLATVGAPDTSIPYLEWATQQAVPIWSGAASWSNWGARFADWAERHGFDIDYAANSDLQDDPTLLDDYRLMLSVGHDEYWSWEMRDTVESFVARGGNVCFFTGNTSYWQVRLEQDGQRMIAYKAKADQDPVMGTARENRNTGIWSHRLTGRPENAMTGVSFSRGGYARIAGATPAGAGGYTIYRPEHWALRGTGLSYGDLLGASSTIVGYECDGCELQIVDGRPAPTGRDGTPTNFEIIGTAPVALWTRDTGPPGFYNDVERSDAEVVCQQLYGAIDPERVEVLTRGHAVMGSYVSAGGGIVFTAGTTDWAYGLDDPQVSTITLNLLTRLADDRSGEGATS